MLILVKLLAQYLIIIHTLGEAHESLSSESKPFQSRSKGEIQGRARREEWLGRSNQATSELKKTLTFKIRPSAQPFL